MLPLLQIVAVVVVVVLVGLELSTYQYALLPGTLLSGA